MKARTQTYKQNVSLFGRELDSKITYTLNGVETELGSEELNSVTPHYEGAILKSVMKQLDIDSNVEIPKETVLNYQFGIKADEDENGNVYEYINYGNYIVYDVEKQEDTNSYKIVCYDKMLYSMKDYEDLGIEYPITIRDYINAICNHLGITFKNRYNIFANYSKRILSERYLTDDKESLGYTFRDVLDELAQVTASTICINEQDDELEIRYINDTNDTIDEEYFKDINVGFGEKYGPINSIVLSRGAESDNVYLQDEESIAQNGLCEIKIVDNQIMNLNDRSDYLPDILNKLDGLEYYLNDYSSTGITYYDLCDRYNVSIGENTYSCIMFNDEVLVTQGLEENVHTDMPEQSETDYTKSDKTDRKLNQTYLIVDKQNQLIEATVKEVDEQNSKISTLEQTIDTFGSKIQDIADLTETKVTTDAILEFEKINASQPLRIEVRPTELENLMYLYPNSNLYPSTSLYTQTRTLRFKNLDTDEIVDYEIPNNLYYYDAKHYDKFVIDYENQKCYVDKMCYLSANGTVQLLTALYPNVDVYPNTNIYPQDIARTFEYPYPLISLTNGDYEVSLLGYDYIYLSATLMKQNKYTTQFATTAELYSAINQTAEEIKIEVSHKVDEEEVASYFDVTAESITAKTGKFAIESDNFTLEEDGTVTMEKGSISKFIFDDDKLTVELTLAHEYTNEDVTRVTGIINGTIQPTSEDYELYDFNQTNTIDDIDLEIVTNLANGTYSHTSTYTIDTTNPIKALSIDNGSTNTHIGAYSSYIDTIVNDYTKTNSIELLNTDTNTYFDLYTKIKEIESRLS